MIWTNSPIKKVGLDDRQVGDERERGPADEQRHGRRYPQQRRGVVRHHHRQEHPDDERKDLSGIHGLLPRCRRTPERFCSRRGLPRPAAARGGRRRTDRPERRHHDSEAVERTSRTSSASGGWRPLPVFCVGHAPAELDAPFLEGNVGHRLVGRGSFPVPLPRRESDHVARADLHDRLPLTLRPADAARHDDRLADRVHLPGRACAGSKGGERAGEPTRPAALEVTAPDEFREQNGG